MTPSWTEMTRAFGRIGLLSFGGPAAQIALMHEELVDRRNWLNDKDFLGALSFCMLLPGPEAMQLATYTGWRLRGTPGGLLAGLLFVLPGAMVIAALAFAYATWGDVPLVRDAFLGIKALVIAIVIQALWKVSKKALTGHEGWIIAALAFVAIFAIGLPFPLIILGAGLYGGLTARSDHAARATPASWGRSARTATLWAALWAAPLLPLWLADQDFLLTLSLFFAKLAVVTFGGAYAVLAYMTQAVVETHGWLGTTQMIDALGLAETTPGPLILVTQFTAHLAGIGAGGWPMGALAGIMALWMTFVPCFLWIFTLAPHVEALLSNPRLKSALTAITAAVVGVILNLSLWFALHVLFAQVDTTGALPIPDPASLDLRAACFTGLAALLIFAIRLPLLPSLAAMAAIATGTGMILSI
ncbi:chromate efflux transporter [Pseudooceanicola onchidii]|uniref:chromate efflux transporter n=1 Tax=Pseudooceanicola onchidii TaxID=2562279 RepID=UPI0010A9E76B|nr:chromate efflux transporter [Pseudooceanicola onchidii]